MRELDPRHVTIVPASSLAALTSVRALETAARRLAQAEIRTSHTLHAGMYARTMALPEGVLVTGALVKIPTVLIVSGDVLVTIGDSTERLTGYAVLPCSAARKQAFLALADTLVTMMFATAATTVDEAEAEFTDEVDMLLSRKAPS